MIVFSFQQVLDEVRGYIVSNPPNGLVRVLTSVTIAHRMGVSRFTANYQERAALNKFDGQVGRAFDKLAAEGVLIKVKGSERGPDGWSRYARYWVPALYEAAVKRSAEQAESKVAETRQWARIHARLAAAGLEPELSDSGESVCLTQEMWVEVLRRLGA
jgi:hypothetical protein